jgi:hypothetical protein
MLMRPFTIISYYWALYTILNSNTCFNIIIAILADMLASLNTSTIANDFNYSKFKS